MLCIPLPHTVGVNTSLWMYPKGFSHLAASWIKTRVQKNPASAVYSPEMIQIDEIISGAQWLFLLWLSVVKDRRQLKRKARKQSLLELKQVGGRNCRNSICDWGQREWLQSVFLDCTDSPVLSPQCKNLLLIQHYRVGIILTIFYEWGNQGTEQLSCPRSHSSYQLLRLQSPNFSPLYHSK